MSHNTSYQQHLARVADLPPWTDDPLARLEHTLATRPPWTCRNCNAINEPDTETCDACGDIDRNRR